jgi:hypothetical protein
MFERLTIRRDNEVFINREVTGWTHSSNWSKPAKEAIARLAAYEDSDLSPEQVRELAKAKAEGRLVVLPYKPGDTVYRIISYKCNAVCNKLNACNSFIYNACKAEFYVCPGTFQLNDMGWIGKTVFLSREEAEKAMIEINEQTTFIKDSMLHCRP